MIEDMRRGSGAHVRVSNMPVVSREDSGSSCQTISRWPVG